MTSTTSTLPPTAEQLTLFPGDHPANHSVMPGSAEAQKMTAISGQKCFGLFELSGQGTSWSKTLAASFLGTTAWFSSKCLLTWKLKTTKSGRLYCQLVPSTPPTDVTGFGFLPTPKAGDALGGVGRTITLSQGRFKSHRKSGQVFGAHLRDVIGNGFLPTPTASDQKGGRTKTNRQESPKSQLKDLIGLTTGKTYPNPAFLEAMMGFPIGWTELRPSETPSSPS